MTGALSRSQVLGEATRLLLEGGFLEAREARASSTLDVRIFEDRRTIVGVCFFERWPELADNWASAQGVLVERISAQLPKSDAKAWEGYLVLVTSEEGVPLEAVAQVRRDTNRLRKLVVTGSELQSLEAVEIALLPVLPLELDDVGGASESLLGRLPAMVETAGIEPALAHAAIEAFEDDRPPMEGIWEWRRST